MQKSYYPLICVGVLCFLGWVWKLQELESRRPARLYQRVPAFQVQGPKGRLRTEKSFRGRWLLLHFWATWCAPCRRELPALARFAQRVKAQKLPLQLAMVSVDKDWKTVHSFFQKHAFFRKSPTVQLPLFLDVKRQVALRYGTKQFPETYLIAPDGRLVEKWAGVVAWDDPEFLSSFTQRFTVERKKAVLSLRNP